MDVRAQLLAWDGRTMHRLEDLSEALEGREGYPAELIELFVERPEAPQVSVGATWLCKRALGRGARLRAEQGRSIARALGGLRSWGARLHVLQFLDRVPLSPKDRDAWQGFVEEAARSEKAFVRAWSLSGLHALAEAFEDLRDVACEAIERGLEDPAASIRARARQLSARGFREHDVSARAGRTGRSRANGPRRGRRRPER